MTSESGFTANLCVVQTNLQIIKSERSATMTTRKLPVRLATVDELLFSTQEERDDMQREKVYDIPLDQIDPLPDHPFRVRDDEEMLSMVESIKQFGVLSPAIAREKIEGRYELISGHRRKRASELAGLAEMPLIVRKLSDDEAAIIMCDSNLQRERILPSEKAHAYKMKLEALKKQGKRTDLTSSPLATKLGTAGEIGEMAGDSKDTVYRFIRLTELIPPLLQLVDEGKITFRPAVEISYLPKKNQRDILAAIEREVCSPSHAQALKMKSFAQDGNLTTEVITSIMMEQKGNQKEQVRIPKESISRFFKKDDSPEIINETIVKALELYRKRERSRDQAR
jgi:ParB family chromosome partitioning protein